VADRPALSRGEMEVVRLVWARGQATVRDVYEALSQKRTVDFFTVQTYLRRLESKGYLRSQRRKRMLVYSPRVQPRTVIRDTVDDLVDRLFDGEAMPLLNHLIQDRGINREEFQQLKELLRQLEDQAHEPPGK
jgi:BlaI family transcriptional regulator, penicillinase repressor